MRRNKLLSAMAGIALVIGLSAVPVVGVAQRAEAATCSWSNWAGYTTGLFVANCTGWTGQVRFRVYCDAVPPFPSWTRASNWMSVPNGAQTMTYKFPTCSGWGIRWTVEYR
jgi:hypothetical protein